MEELKRTPLYEEHMALGARMVPFAGWDMPVQYSGIIEEHKAVRSCAGVFDVSHMAEFRVFGAGAKDFLQETLTNDLDRIDALGSAQYTLMLAEDGGIIDDLIVYHTGDIEYLIVANASNRDEDLGWLKGRVPDGVELVDESDRTGLIALQGPAALGVLQECAGPGYSPPERFFVGPANLDGVPCLVARTGYTGEDGVELICRSCDAVALWRLLLSFPEVTPIGLGARDTLRLEMGYPLYGSDMDRSIDPVSAGLGWVCPKGKSGYVGAERVREARANGTVSRLAFLVVADGIPRHGYPVLHAGTQVGKVASGSFSPTLESGIATAYLPSELVEPGTQVEVAIRKKSAQARVVKPPFVSATSIAG
jgi:aminomethyltransferase